MIIITFSIANFIIFIYFHSIIREKGAKMKNFIERLGHIKTVLLIVIISITSSLLLYLFISYMLNLNLTYNTFLIALITPLIISPIISWYLVSFLFHMIELESKMRNLATQDSLTNLLTRQSFLDSILTIYQLAKRNKLNFTILYIDVDNFKSINDTYGHTVGDKVLKSLGKILQQNKRESDLVGRLGGEEFAYALPDADLSGALFFAEKVRKLVENDMFENNGIYINYTISIGVSIYHKNNEVALDQLISQADTALYRAKEAGKNCVKVY